MDADNADNHKQNDGIALMSVYGNADTACYSYRQEAVLFVP